MKRLFLVCFSFLLFCVHHHTTAQIIGKKSIFDYSSFGIRLGLNFQSIQSATLNSGYNPGVLGGIYIRKYWDKVGFRLDAGVSTAHYTTQKPLVHGLSVDPKTDTLRKADFVPAYINVPLVVEYKVHSKLLLVAGIQYNYLFSATDNTGVYNKFVKDNDIFVRSAFAAVVGGELKIGPKIRLGIRYIHGITDVNNGKFSFDNKAWTASSFQLAISCQLWKYYGQ